MQKTNERKIKMQKENNIIDHSVPQATPSGGPARDERSEQLVSESQTGRSMVEMLGVLAVMGVLSVGGVAMYTSAMNKHRANELLNEASKRAAAVAAQISMQGKEANDNLIADFTNPSGYTFGVEKKNANQFNITINAVDDDICAQMNAASGTNTPIRNINNGCTELTFNNDMSTTVWASDFASESECRGGGKTWCSGQGTNGACSDSSDCCAGFTENACQTCDTETGTITNLTDSCDLYGTADGFCYNGSCINCDNFSGTSTSNTGGVVAGTICRCASGYKWDSTNEECVAATLNAACTTQDDCGGTNSDYFCKITRYTQNGSCTDSNTSYYGGLSGTCQPLGTPVSASISGLGNVIAGPDEVNWWSAKNWCEAQGKHLINIEDFQIYRSGTTTKVVTNTTWSYGCASGKTCGDWHNNGMWKAGSATDARTLTSAGETLQANYSPVLVALAKEFRGMKKLFWTASDHGNGPCHVLYVNLETGTVGGYSRHSVVEFSALCE